MRTKLKEFLINKLNSWKKYLLEKYKQLEEQPVLQLVVFSIALNFMLEILSRRSVFKGIGAIWDNPLMFVYNVLIILASYTVATFFARKDFWKLFVTTVWLGLGIMNFVMLGYRTTPLTAVDFMIAGSVASIVHVYLNNFEIVLIGVIVIILLGCIAYAFFKLPKKPVQIKNTFYVLCCIIVLMLGVSNVSFKAHAVTSDFGNIGEAFKNYGFAYCFTTSIIDSGINKPDEYSPETVEVVLDTIETEASQPEATAKLNEASLDVKEAATNQTVAAINVVATANHNQEPVKQTNETPNIVFIQLESFFDVNHLVNFQFSENPTPHFTKLKEQYSSGFLTVPSIGAGTANTEFEVISGMSLDYFGAGEYPYKTILKDTTCESVCYDLEERGYISHAIHNNSGTFYSRNTVFPKLGFDTFTSIEYMNDVTYNPLGWSKDEILTKEIIKTLDATVDQDFIYAISVQPHGKYPETVVDDHQKVTITGDLEETAIVGYEYYLNQLSETDVFIGELLETLSNYQEPVVVVMYGDHLPSMNIEDIDLDNANKFQTEYVMWSNFSMDKVRKDVNAYQLTSYVMGRLGYDNGILTKFHQNNSDLSNYQEELVLLQYDMLYGDQNVFGGVNPHIEKKMTMGVQEIKITGIRKKGEVIFVEGVHFTPWSQVYMDGIEKETLFVDEKTLIVTDETLENVRSIYVGQADEGEMPLSQSKEWLVHNEQIEE